MRWTQRVHRTALDRGPAALIFERRTIQRTAVPSPFQSGDAPPHSKSHCTRRSLGHSPSGPSRRVPLVSQLDLAAPSSSSRLQAVSSTRSARVSRPRRSFDRRSPALKQTRRSDQGQGRPAVQTPAGSEVPRRARDDGVDCQHDARTRRPNQAGTARRRRTGFAANFVAEPGSMSNAVNRTENTRPSLKKMSC